ncbi:MAG TPA: lactate permease LctP family transporter [Hanamia sp.]|nr:lactate permease LctP family transporter [Hanamia sp.]
MIWKQITSPFDNIYLSLLMAVLPILFIFWALIIKKMKGHQASLIATGLAVIIAIVIYGMPVKLALLSTASGALYGLFPICWLIIAALFLFNITVESGQFEILKHFMASITSDRRLQVLLIAFSFGSFLEGTAGFGAPVAITAAMLVGLGFNPLYAAGLCLIANTAPVAFGSIGIPITVASKVSSIPEIAISQMVGRTLPFLSAILPFYLIILMCGWKKSVEVLPAILVSGISFGLIQWSCANFIGPALPDILAGIGSIISLVIFLRFWKPKKAWKFPDEEEDIRDKTEKNYSSNQVLKACSPFIFLTIMIVAWGLTPIKLVLDTVGQMSFEFPGIHNTIMNVQGGLIPHVYRFNYLSAAGTAIFISCLIAIPIIGMKYKDAFKVFISTIKKLKYPIITIGSIMGFASLLNDSGIVLTIAGVLANTGHLFPFFAPILGWLGVFITGSDTSSNALFGNLQAVTAHTIGVNPVVTVAANASGGVIGKMISPSSIAVAAAAGDLVGKESDLFRFTLKHSFILLMVVCLLVLGQSYLFPSIIPKYTMNSINMSSAEPLIMSGIIYLLILALVLGIIAVTIRFKNKVKKKE